MGWTFKVSTLSELSQSVLLPVSLQGSGPLALSTGCMFVNPCAIHEVPRIRLRALLTLQKLAPDCATTGMHGRCSQFAPEDTGESSSVPNAQGLRLIPGSHYRDKQDLTVTWCQLKKIEQYWVLFVIPPGICSCAVFMVNIRSFTVWYHKDMTWKLLQELCLCFILSSSCT